MAKSENTRPVTVRDIARESGFSRTTVSAALGADGRVAPETRARVEEVARRMGWRRDPQVAQLLAYLRTRHRRHASSNLAWLNTHESADVFRVRPWLAGYLRGARDRARELGYALDEIWTRGKGVTPGGINRMLAARGVRGVLLPMPRACPVVAAIRPETLAWLVVDEAEADLPAHRVSADRHHNLWLALTELKALGYRRPGLWLARSADALGGHRFSSAYLGWCHEHRVKPRLPRPLPTESTEAELVAWARSERPDVIVCADNRVVAALRAAGLRVPGDIGVAHLNLAADVAAWAGVDQNYERIGAVAVDQLVAAITRRSFGQPEEPQETMVRGRWRAGTTVAEATLAERT